MKKTPIIQVKNLYKIYRVGETKVRALNGVDLTLYKGEFCSDCRNFWFWKVYAAEYAGRTGEANQGGNYRGRTPH